MSPLRKRDGRDRMRITLKAHLWAINQEPVFINLNNRSDAPSPIEALFSGKQLDSAYALCCKLRWKMGAGLC